MRSCNPQALSYPVTDPEPKPFLGSLTGEVGRDRNFHGGRQTPEVSFRIAGAVTFPGSQQLRRLPCSARYWLRGGYGNNHTGGVALWPSSEGCTGGHQSSCTFIEASMCCARLLCLACAPLQEHSREDQQGRGIQRKGVG